jgi:hypothetical protein
MAQEFRNYHMLSPWVSSTSLTLQGLPSITPASNI